MNIVTIDDFITQFSELNEHNQKYIIAIQQALVYAQESEKVVERNNNQNTIKYI